MDNVISLNSLLFSKLIEANAEQLNWNLVTKGLSKEKNKLCNKFNTNLSSLRSSRIKTTRVEQKSDGGGIKDNKNINCSSGNDYEENSDGYDDGKGDAENDGDHNHWERY